MDKIEKEKRITEILVGKWEFIITNPDSSKKSDEVIIDKSFKYYKNGEYMYDIEASFEGANKENINIHKTDISNKGKFPKPPYFFEILNYNCETRLSGTDEYNNSIEYVKYSK